MQAFSTPIFPTLLSPKPNQGSYFSKAKKTPKMSILSRTPSSSSSPPPLIIKILSKRRTWVSLFLAVYSLLLYFSWNLILSLRSYYNSATPSSFYSVLYCSLLYGGVFGILSMAAALAVAVPATMVTWITILVLLAFAGNSRKDLVSEGKRISRDILKFGFKILIREGNFVAGVCGCFSFFVLVLKRRGSDLEDDRDL